MNDYQLENRKGKLFKMFVSINIKNLCNLTTKRICNFYNKNHFLDHNPIK